MYARVVLGATKSVPFREVSSIQGCPYRGVPLYYDAGYESVCMHTCVYIMGVVWCVSVNVNACVCMLTKLLRRLCV